MVTLLGFVFVMYNILLMEVMDSELQGPKYGWVYFSYAFGVCYRCFETTPVALEHVLIVTFISM